MMTAAGTINAWQGLAVDSLKLDGNLIVDESLHGNTAQFYRELDSQWGQLTTSNYVFPNTSVQTVLNKECLTEIEESLEDLEDDIIFIKEEIGGIREENEELKAMLEKIINKMGY